MKLRIYEVVSGGTKEHHPPGGEDWSVIVAAESPTQARKIAWRETNQGVPWAIYEWGIDARENVEPGILRGPFECCPAVNRQWKMYELDPDDDSDWPAAIEQKPEQ